jgi:4-hydroxy-tetrahydrodipicolinate reductase
VTVRVLVVGAAGRMGRAVIEAVGGRSDVAIAGAVDKGDYAEALLDACDVYVDFSAPQATRTIAQHAAAKRRAAVIGTTGLAADDDAALAALAKVAPIVVAANFSLGVNVVLGLARQVAHILGPEWDAEIVETHHNNKRDAPSGTALARGGAVGGGRGGG